MSFFKIASSNFQDVLRFIKSTKKYTDGGCSVKDVRKLPIKIHLSNSYFRNII